MAARHIVFAGVERFAVKDTDAPVEVGLHEFLPDDEVGFLEQFIQLFAELRLVIRLGHAVRKGAVGLLEHAGKGDPLAGRAGFEGFLLQNHGARRGHFGLSQTLRQINLVGTAQNRKRVVDHHQPFGKGLAREAVGMMIHRRRFANKQRIKLRQAAVILFRYKLGIDVQLVGRFLELLQRLLARRRVFLFRVHQNGEIKGILLDLAFLKPLARKIAAGKIRDMLLITFRNQPQRKRRNLLNQPFRGELKADFQQRRLKKIIE